MSEKSRKSFTSQHKAKVALEAIRGTKTLNEIAQEFAVHPTQVGEWKKVLLAQAPGVFDAKRGPKPDDPSASPERLYSEIGRLKMGLDWLKKSPGLASRGPQTLGRSARSPGAYPAMRVSGRRPFYHLCPPFCRLTG